MTRRCAARLGLALLLGACSGGGESHPHVQDDLSGQSQETINALADALDAPGRADSIAAQGDVVAAQWRAAGELAEVQGLGEAGTNAYQRITSPFIGRPDYSEDTRLIAYARAAAENGNTAIIAAFRRFLLNNLNGEVIWSPNAVLHALRILLGEAEPDSLPFWDDMVGINATLDAAEEFLARHPQLAVETRQGVVVPDLHPSCQRSYILVGETGGALTWTDPSAPERGVQPIRLRLTIPETAQDGEFDAEQVAIWARDIGREGGGTPTTAGGVPVDEYRGSKATNCGIFAMYLATGDDRWTGNMDPTRLWVMLNQAGVIDPVSASEATAGDLVIYCSSDEGDETVRHFATVVRREGLLNGTIVVRNKDGNSPIFEAASDAYYFTGRSGAYYAPAQYYRLNQIVQLKADPEERAYRDGITCGNVDFIVF